MSEREDCIINAKIAEQVERYDDMAANMKKVASSTTPLSNEERNLLSVAYKNVVGTRRASWRVIASLELKSKEKSESPRKQELCKGYKEKIEKELNDICDEVISLLDDHLIPNVGDGDGESKIFYLKMKGDYYRYKVEVASESNTSSLADLSQEAYKEAYETAKAKMEPTHPIRLGLALNYSVYYYEIKKEPDSACELAKKAFDDAISVLDETAEDTLKDSTLILQLLRDNLTLWSSEIENDGDGDKDQQEQ